MHVYSCLEDRLVDLALFQVDIVLKTGHIGNVRIYAFGYTAIGLEDIQGVELLLKLREQLFPEDCKRLLRGVLHLCFEE